MSKIRVLAFLVFVAVYLIALVTMAAGSMFSVVTNNHSHEGVTAIAVLAVILGHIVWGILAGLMYGRRGWCMGQAKPFTLGNQLVLIIANCWGAPVTMALSSHDYWRHGTFFPAPSDR